MADQGAASACNRIEGFGFLLCCWCSCDEQVAAGEVEVVSYCRINLLW